MNSTTIAFSNIIREKIDHFLKNDPNSKNHVVFHVGMEFNPTDDSNYILSEFIKSSTSIYGDNEITIYQNDTTFNEDEITENSKKLGEKFIELINFGNKYFNNVIYFQFELSPLGTLLVDDSCDFNDIKDFNYIVEKFSTDNWCYGGLFASIVGTF